MKEGLRHFLLVGVLAAALGSAAGLAAAAEPFPVAFGGDFALVDQNGQTRNSEEFRGRLRLVFFGYTACPHTCGMALNTMSAVLDELGPDVEKIVPLFVSVDPDYDNPARLASHLRNFHPAIVGLTGHEADLSAIRGAFRASASAVADPGAFERLVDHSTFIYLTGRDNEPLSLLQPMMPPYHIAEIVRGYL